MAKILHIDDLIKPGLGPAISVKPIIDSYILRYNQFSAKDIKIYAIKDKKDYIVHAMVPSEQNDEFEKPVYYDVILQFYPTDKDIESELTIRNYGIKVFSNAISWMFNFTYVFEKTGNIPSFIPKKYCSEQALKNPPKKTNPYDIFGIERVVFTALYHLEQVTGYRKNRLLIIELPNTKPNDIVNRLMSQEEKLAQLNLEKKKLQIQKKKEKIKNKAQINIINRKERQTDRIINKLDKNFDANLKSDMKADNKKSMKSTNLKKK